MSLSDISAISRVVNAFSRGRVALGQAAELSVHRRTEIAVKTTDVRRKGWGEGAY